MARKKPSPSTKIIRTVVGFSDPTLEKIGDFLVASYQKNRALGKKPGVALRGAVNDVLEPLTGRRLLRERIPFPKSPPRTSPRNPPEPHEETELETIARLKRELDNQAKS